MLSMSKNSFKIKHPLPDMGPRRPKSPNMSGKRNGNRHTLQCIAGEYIQATAGHVKKSSSSRDGEGHIPGTLYCTNLRVAFLPDSSPNDENDSCYLFMCSDYEVALPCIGKLVAVNSFTKTKVLTSTSTLKFIPEELIIYCRDFRVLRFQFHEHGLESQAFQVTMAIVQAQENSGRDTCYEYLALKNLGNSCLGKQDTQLQEDFSVVLFETLCDWEKELKRLGAASWRVSPVNERFDMSTSLPKYLWVPSQFLDNELKRAFVHFNERRIPRLCWHHPRGSDLLRAANFHTNSDPEKEDIRAIETLLFAGHSQCVIVEATADLPGLPEIHQSYSKLWNLSLWLTGKQNRKTTLLPRSVPHRNSSTSKDRAECRNAYTSDGEMQDDKRSSNIRPFSNFVRQEKGTNNQVDTSLAPSDEKWLSSLESTRWLDHVRLCLKKASEVTLLLTERSRSVILQESDDRDLNCLLASLVQVLSDPHMRTIPGFQSLIQKEWVAAGHPFLQRLNVLQKNNQDESPVFFLFLDSVWQLLQQFPQSFEFTEAYLMAVYDSCFIPFSSTFLFNCQWERSRKNQNRFLNQIYTPINGWQENLCLEILQKGDYPVKNVGHTNLSTIWNWPLRFNPWQRAQFRNPWYNDNNFSNGGTLNKKFLFTNSDKMENTSSEKWTLYIFSKGSLSLQTHIFPWKNGTLSKKSSHRVQALETSREQERCWKAKSNGNFIYHNGLLLLPSHTGTSIRLWKRCYLRGNPEVQVGLFASNIVKLCEELDLLQKRLTYLKQEEAIA